MAEGETTAVFTGEVDAAGRAHRFLALDSLRGLCATSVVFFHFQSNGVLTNLPFFRQAWLMVDFFFVLSGFVLAYSYGAKLQRGYSPTRFMTLRLGRIYPLHLFVVGLYLALELLVLLVPSLSPRPAFGGAKTVESLVETLAFLQTFDLGPLSWNPPAWSIAAEFWAYLLCAAAFALARQQARLVFGIVLAASLALLVLHFGTLDLTDDWGVVRCFFGFSLGVLVQQPVVAAIERMKTLPAWLATLAEVAAVGAVIGFVSLAGHGATAIAAPFVFAAALALFAVEGGHVSRLLLTRPLRWLGLMSYSIYLLHVFVIGRVLDVLAIGGRRIGLEWVTVNGDGTKSLLAPGAFADLVVIATVVLVALLAAITYALIEKPGREYSRRLAGVR